SAAPAAQRLRAIQLNASALSLYVEPKLLLPSSSLTYETVSSSGSSHGQHENSLSSPRSMQHAFMKRASVRIAFVIITLAAAAAIVIGALVRHAAGRELREAILAELQPVALKNCTLK